MVNFDGVFELRIHYSSTLATAPVLPHVLKVDLDVVGDPTPGTVFNDIVVTLAGGGTDTLDVWLLTFTDVLQPCFSADTDFVFAELWKIPEGTLNGTFISSEELGFQGTNAGANVLAQQTTFTFRSRGGGNGRIQLMESAFSGSLRQTPPFASAAANNLTNFVKGITSCILARDNTEFIARIHQCDGQNEIIWRKRNRL